MKTFPIESKDGHCFAFEIENAYIASGQIVQLLQEVEGVTDIRARKPFSSSSDIHVSFGYKGQEFVVWEPYGDSSRYWIGPKDENEHSTDVTVLQEVFAKYAPSLPKKIIGDLITLNFKELFQRGA